MSNTIDWLYRRNNCKTCEKAEAYLSQHHVEVLSTTDARKDKQNEKAALALAKTVDVIITTKGKNYSKIDLKKDKPDKATLLAALLGPTGNLRAPAFRKGAILFVGFHPDGYGEVLE